MALSFRQAQAALAEIKYKPGWSLALQEPCGPYGVDEVVVWVTIRNVVDARGHIVPRSGLDTTLMLNSASVSLRLFPDKESFQRWVFKVAIRAAEEHEMGEWFTVNGERWYDPHKSMWPTLTEGV